MASKNQCGFFNTIYFFNFKTSAEVTRFNERHRIRGVTVKEWGRKRRATRKELLQNGSYTQNSRGGEKNAFLEHFSLTNFETLDESRKSQHTYRNCQECAQYHRDHFLLKRSNTVVSKTGPTATTTTPQSLATSLESVKAVLEKTPKDITKDDVENVVQQVINPVTTILNKTNYSTQYYKKILGRRKINDINLISKQAKRQILKEATQDITERLVQKDFVALYSSKQSQAEWDRQRVDSYGEYKASKKKTHTCNLNSVTFKTDLLLKALENGSDQINWTTLSKKVELKKNGIAIKGNGGQVSTQF